MKRVLIVGNGYIGENLSYYLSSNHSVTVFSRSAGYRHPNITYVLGEIESMDILLKNQSYDIVVNAFGCSRLDSFDEYNHFCNTNVYLLSKVLDYVVSIKAKLIYPSTSLCLSNTDQSFYSFSHQMAINTIKQYKVWYNMPYEICYIHNVYGSLTNSPKKHKMLIDVILEAYELNNSMTLFNGGTQKRVFTHIYDVVKYFELSLDSIKCNEVNLVNNYYECTVKELVNIFDLKIENRTNKLYTKQPPFTNLFGTLYGWSETINIKDWLKDRL